MMKRTYGQFCGVARALEVVGERWALLIVRDLLVGPRRFTNLRRGLPKIPTNILAARLQELEDAGVVRRRALPRPASGVVYELTAYGEELEPVILGLGRWGAQSLGMPREEEIVTADSMIMALRTTFQPEAARGMQASYECHFGAVVINARIIDGRLAVAAGPLPDADLVLTATGPINPLLTGALSPTEAIERGLVRITGDPVWLERFVSVFRIGAGVEVG
ncbi:MAG TPA: helix-turn-helix domain-containing protein [Thermomicrobiales bacterium]|jgi:DNA-binding HxlR family transcriptional regulator